MSVVYSPNMSLPVPDVGSEAGPQYAFDINSCMSLLDAHDHTPGRGVQITPAGININSSLTLGNNFLINAAGMTFDAQSSPAANNTIYESGVDLYYVDGNGNNVRITQSGGLAGSPGSISNLTSPASASYVAGNMTFVWQSNTNIAANLDCGSVLLRNLSPNSTNAVTLSPPASLASNYSITLPTLPGSQSIMTIDSTGTITAPSVYPLTSTGLAANSVGTSQLQANSVTRAKLAAVGQQLSGTAALTVSSTSYTAITGLTVTITTTGRPVIVTLQPLGSIGSESEFRVFVNSGTHSPFAMVMVSRDGGSTAVFTNTIGSRSAATSGSVGSDISVSAAVSFVDTPAAGTYTYQGYVAVSNTAVHASMISYELAAYEL